MRLIDVDKLKEYIDDCKCCEKCDKIGFMCNDDCELPDCVTPQWERVLNEQPTVDAVPIVRCNDCKHKTKCYSDVVMIDKSRTADIYESVQWCSLGERE